MNLYEEINDNVKALSLTLDDILFVSGIDLDNIERSFDPKEFLEHAKKINYNNGYGWVEINQNLRIVFKDGSFLMRTEYDGSEGFDYIKIPNLNAKIEKYNPRKAYIKNGLTYCEKD